MNNQPPRLLFSPLTLNPTYLDSSSLRKPIARQSFKDG